MIHTAPEHGTAVFAEAPGVIPIALHPNMVFTGTSLDLARLSGATVAVTAPAVVQPIGQALVVEMGAEPVIVSESDRQAYAEAVIVAAEAARLATADAILTLQRLGIARADRIVGGAVHAAVDEEAARYVGDPELGALAAADCAGASGRACCRACVLPGVRAAGACVRAAGRACCRACVRPPCPVDTAATHGTLSCFYGLPGLALWVPTLI